MFCNHCGKKVEDGSLSCPWCGAALGGAAPASQTEAERDLQPCGSTVSPMKTVSPMETAAPDGGNRRRRGMLLAIAGGAAALLLILAAVVLGSGLLGSAKGNLSRAAAKSVNALRTAADSVGLPDLAKLSESRQVRSDMSFQIRRFSDALTGAEPKLAMLEGFGFSAQAGADLPGRRMDLSATVSYGAAGLLTVLVQADGSVVSVGCPELLGGNAYGLDTRTLGRDLDNLGADLPEEMKNMSFDLFDAIEIFSRRAEPDQAALKALYDAIEVEKDGKADVKVNGHMVSCTDYWVCIPQEALLDWLDAAGDAYAALGMEEDVMELLRSMGIPESELEALRESGAFGGEETLEVCRQAVRAIGDVELTVYVSDGYVMSAVWKTAVEGGQLEVTADFGGGENYADDLSLELLAGDVHLRFASTGSHGAAEGAYTDSSTLVFEEEGYESATIQSDLSYDPRKAADNFRWTVEGGGAALTAEGQVTAGEDSLFVDLDQLAVSTGGEELVRLSASYGVRPYTAPDASAGEPVMLSAMDESGLQALAGEIYGNAQSWLMGLMTQAPELFQLFL